MDLKVIKKDNYWYIQRYIKILFWDIPLGLVKGNIKCDTNNITQELLKFTNEAEAEKCIEYLTYFKPVIYKSFKLIPILPYWKSDHSFLVATMYVDEVSEEPKNLLNYYLELRGRKLYGVMVTQPLSYIGKVSYLESVVDFYEKY